VVRLGQGVKTGLDVAELPSPDSRFFGGRTATTL
jgi:hypothetical protein